MENYLLAVLIQIWMTLVYLFYHSLVLLGMRVSKLCLVSNFYFLTEKNLIFLTYGFIQTVVSNFLKLCLSQKPTLALRISAFRDPFWYLIVWPWYFSSHLDSFFSSTCYTFNHTSLTVCAGTLLSVLCVLAYLILLLHGEVLGFVINSSFYQWGPCD